MGANKSYPLLDALEVSAGNLSFYERRDFLKSKVGTGNYCTYYSHQTVYA